MVFVNEFQEVCVKVYIYDLLLQSISDKIKIIVFQWRDKEVNFYYYSYFLNLNVKSVLELE